MKYTIKYDANTGVCTIEVVGPHRRPDDSHELLRIAGIAAKEHQSFRFLFDMRQARITSDTMATFETANDPEKHGFSRGYRIAAVYPAITADHAFLEDVAVNRGAVAFRVFNDIDEARQWIASE